MSRGREFCEEEWRFLQSLLKAFSDAGIAAPILRNYDGLPRHVGNDLDIFITRLDLARAEEILIEQVSLSGGQMIKKFRKDSFTAWWMRIGDSPLLHIDLFNGAYYWRGRQLESDEQILKNMKTHSLGFHIPSPFHQAFSMFVTSLIWGGFYQDRYGETMEMLLVNDEERERFDSLMEKNFGGAGSIPFAFNDKPASECVKKYVQELRGGIRWRWFKKAKPKEWYCVLRYWLWEILNLVRPSGDWLIATEEDDLCGLFASELMHTYGGYTELRYSRRGPLSWLWFRLRYVQRRMARNELVIVRVKKENITETVKKLLGRPTLIPNEIVESFSEKLIEDHYKIDEVEDVLWRKTAAKF